MSNESSQRVLILRAVITAVENRRDVLDLVATEGLSEDMVAEALKDRYGFDDLQAQSVLALQLRNFTAAKTALLAKELDELESD